MEQVRDSVRRVSRSFPNALLTRSGMGVLEVALHTDAGTLERIRFNPARIQLRRSSWHIRWA
jgi:hypothetical protein